MGLRRNVMRVFMTVDYTLIVLFVATLQASTTHF